MDGPDLHVGLGSTAECWTLYRGDQSTSAVRRRPAGGMAGTSKEANCGEQRDGGQDRGRSYSGPHAGPLWSLRGSGGATSLIRAAGDRASCGCGEPATRRRVPPFVGGGGRRRDRRGVRADGGAGGEVAAAHLGDRRGRADPAGGGEGLRPVRPGRGAAAQDDARGGAQAVPGRHAVRAHGMAYGRADRRRRTRPPRGAVPVAGAGGAADSRAHRGAGDCAANLPDRALPVHRGRGPGGDDPLEDVRSSRDQGGDSGPPRSRQDRSVVNRRPLCAATVRGARAGPPAGRAPRDRRAAERGRRRDARSRAHAEGGGRAGERAAPPVGGGGVLGRVRRPARCDRDGGQALRPHPLLCGGQAGLRPARRLTRAATRCRR